MCWWGSPRLHLGVSKDFRVQNVWFQPFLCCLQTWKITQWFDRRSKRLSTKARYISRPSPKQVWTSGGASQHNIGGSDVKALCVTSFGEGMWNRSWLEDQWWNGDWCRVRKGLFMVCSQGSCLLQFFCLEFVLFGDKAVQAFAAPLLYGWQTCQCLRAFPFWFARRWLQESQDQHMLFPLRMPR